MLFYTDVPQNWEVKFSPLLSKRCFTSLRRQVYFRKIDRVEYPKEIVLKIFKSQANFSSVYLVLSVYQGDANCACY